jgi:hypothetical protein
MTVSRSCAALLTATLTLFTATPLRAGEITGFAWFSGVASVAGATVFPPSSPNNDNVTGTSPNGILVTQKHYVGIGPVDLVFDVSDTGGVTEYLFMEGVHNDTGADWSGYHLELGFGNGAGFVASLPGDGLDFDAPDFDSDFFFDPFPGVFPAVTVGEDDILAGGGVQPDSAFAGNFLFHVDVPDGITSFTIRQSPIAVPEPSTLALACLGLLGLSASGRRKRAGGLLGAAPAGLARRRRRRPGAKRA